MSCEAIDIVIFMLDSEASPCDKVIMSIIRFHILCPVLLLLPIVCCAFTNNDTAKTISTDGSATDTQNAINYMVSKAQDGWVITVGTAGGNYSWAASVSVPGSFVQSYTIQGAGSSSTRPTIVSTHSNYSSLSIATNNGKLARLTNFIFSSTGTQSGAFLTVQPPTNGIAHQSFRVDHCRFQDCHNFAVRVAEANQNIGTTYGLFDHNDFYETSGGNGIYIFAGNNANQWQTSMTWGTVDTVVIEDCTFTCTATTVPGNPAIDSAYNGARWCARHNTFTNWVCVLHGADSAPTSTLQVEFNHNTVTSSTPVDYGLYCRGGCIMATGNTFSPAANFPNQTFKFANDSSNGFQKVGDGAVNGVEKVLGAYYWNNSPNYLGGASGLTVGVNMFNVAPGAGLPTTSYTELVYPHPLQNSPALPLAPAAPGNLHTAG
jgi:hypothetical protein